MKYPVSEDEKVRDSLLDKLRDLQLSGPIHSCVGICNNMDLDTREHDLLLELLGNKPYPVEGSVEEYRGNSNMWDKRTVFGKKRWALLSELINVLEN